MRALAGSKQAQALAPSKRVAQHPQNIDNSKRKSFTVTARRITASSSSFACAEVSAEQTTATNRQAPGLTSKKAFGDHVTKQKRSQIEMVAALELLCLEICREHDLPIDRARKAARKAGKQLLAEHYMSDLSLPDVAPAFWYCRSGKDKMLSPIEFQEKYWGRYIEEDLLSQADLKRFDISLYDAITNYCKNRKIKPNLYLPAASKTKSKHVVEVLKGNPSRVAPSRRQTQKPRPFSPLSN